MANAAFETGYHSGLERGSESRLRKQALKDEELHMKVNDLIDQRKSHLSNLQMLKPGTTDYDQSFNALRQTDTDIRTLLHPDTNPGALAKVGHLLTDHLGITNPQKRIEAVAQKRNKALAGDETMARGQAAAVPLSPEKQAEIKGRASAAEVKAQLDNANRLYDQNNPDVSESDRKTAHYENYQSIVLGRRYTQTRNNKPDIQQWEIKGPDGKAVKTFTGQWDSDISKWVYPNTGEEIPADVMSEATMVPKATAQGKPKGLKYDQVTGQVVDQDTAKRYSLDDVGKPGTPPEVLSMFNGAKATMDKKQQNALALANERGKSFATNRFGSFIDPANPTQVIPVPFGEAAKRGLHLAVGAQYQTMAAMLKSATSGPIGNEIVAFSTALQHADLLEQAAKNLDNPDTRVLAKISNDLKTQFGDERPTDFNVIANAYTREVTKALTSGHVTDNEISENGATIPRDASPAQILGAIAAYRRLMQSKINIRRDQIMSGMAGQPYLGEPPSPAATPAGGTVPKGATHIKTWTDPATHKVHKFYVDKDGNNLGEKTQ